jgi:hypothetical protein
MMQNGVTIQSRIFDNDFTVTKEMLTDELKEFHPKRMCGWKPEYMSEIIQSSYIAGKNILERWTNLK